jgi:arylsulfatase A-like enzyme
MRRRLPPLLAALSLAACGAEEVPRPHVVLIVIDTLRADVMLGPGSAETHPHVAALARDGVVFPQAFTHAPLTLPAHTSLFSSRLPAETGVLANAQKVPADLPLLAEWLARSGYATRAVVSLGTLVPKGAGLARGFQAFDTDFSFMADGADTAERLRRSLDGWMGMEPLFLFAHFCDPHAPYRAHGTDAVEVVVRVDGAEVARIDASASEPRHVPVELAPGEHEVAVEAAAPFEVRSLRLRGDRGLIEPTWTAGGRNAFVQEASATFRADAAGEHRLTAWVSDVTDQETKRRRYLLEAAHADRFVGELIAELKERGIYDDSLILLQSDHGEALGEHGFVGHASVLADVALHVPLVIKPPKGHPLAETLERRAPNLVSLIDLAPTILAFCAAPPLPGQRGISLTEARGPREHVAQTHKPDSKQDKVCLRDERFKMVYIRDDDRFTMYDLAADPREDRNVFAQRAHERTEWPARLRAIAEEAVGRRGADGPDGVSLEMLEALGYAGGG